MLETLATASTTATAIGIIMIAALKSLFVTKKEFDKEQNRCQGALHRDLAEMKSKQSSQTAWIMAIAQATGVKKEDVREL